MIERVIVPLDVSSLSEAIAWVDRLKEVSFWKVGLELFVSTGPEILGILKDKQKRIFLDLKLHDIPNTMIGACRAAQNYEVDLLTLHISAGKRALEAIALGLDPHKPLPKLLGITLLTSLNARDLAFELNIPLELPEYVLKMALLAQESGLNGVVCSPQEVEQLRGVCDPNFLLVCPGVRPDWSKKDDQSRTMTPQAALAAGADYLVIGRPLTQASDPLAAWEQLKSEL
ncbi:orotidine-5'-phosphate decarboxylase [Gloeocapsa sp. PCC 73106]|uniref:orotidine-5'-phosphate decarboxylase n=1 Tax=Gloeocapsa sp. PCC 73106 TaxID=102232 RepID=UPI0002AD0383|nr:orotidine-5'-phosphate decarboxylase [Gloeocapsa sp. PCC 73106]ELR99315.1 orotidine-5'-phosphate decarboxylase [Gloeocapsa sp. PCC 73106]